MYNNAEPCILIDTLQPSFRYSAPSLLCVCFFFFLEKYGWKPWRCFLSAMFFFAWSLFNMHCLFVVMAEKVTGLLSLKNTITIYYSLLHYHLDFNNNSHPKNSTYCACKELNYNNRSRYNTLKSNQLFLLGLKRKLRLRMNSQNQLWLTHWLYKKMDGMTAPQNWNQNISIAPWGHAAASIIKLAFSAPLTDGQTKNNFFSFT